MAATAEGVRIGAAKVRTKDNGLLTILILLQSPEE
jgi:hypothetical protein